MKILFVGSLEEGISYDGTGTGTYLHTDTVRQMCQIPVHHITLEPTSVAKGSPPKPSTPLAVSSKD